MHIRAETEPKPKTAVTCPGCTAAIDENTPRQEYVSSFDGTRYKLYRCHGCALEFWSPLRMIPEFYEREGFHAYQDFHAGNRPFPRWTLPFFDHIETDTGLLLDVGCGDGAFLERAARSGLRAHGVDLDRRSVAVARRRPGLELIEFRDLASHARYCNERGIRYDVITFFEVLEHQDDPANFLRLVTALLAPKAKVAGTVPNRDRFLGSITKRFDEGDLPPHHFLRFSANVLCDLLARHGFVEIKVITSGHMRWREIDARIGPALTHMTARWPRPVRGIVVTLGRLLSKPAALLISLGMRWRPPHLYFQAQRAD